MAWTDKRRKAGDGSRRGPGRLEVLLSAAGHVTLLVLGLVTFTSSASPPQGGEGGISVSMVTVEPPGAAAPDDGRHMPEPPEVEPEEAPEEERVPSPEESVEPEEAPQEEPLPEESVEPEEAPQEEPLPEESVEPEEAPQEEPLPEVPAVEPAGYASVGSQGGAGAGAPGPGTYESRVFNAIRRNFRTSVEPGSTYRMIFTVHPDGRTEVETVRTSGTAAFDRAVENAIAMASIPPMPPGRTAPVTLRIEFTGPGGE